MKEDLRWHIYKQFKYLPSFSSSCLFLTGEVEGGFNPSTLTFFSKTINQINQITMQIFFKGGLFVLMETPIG